MWAKRRKEKPKRGLKRTLSMTEAFFQTCRVQGKKITRETSHETSTKCLEKDNRSGENQPQ